KENCFKLASFLNEAVKQINILKFELSHTKRLADHNQLAADCAVEELGKLRAEVSSLKGSLGCRQFQYKEMCGEKNNAIWHLKNEIEAHKETILFLGKENNALKARVDRVKNVEVFATILYNQPHHGMPLDDCILAAKAIQSYILGGKGENNI
ncbi:MAG: hypothetical protein ACRC5T_11245, partial [Cetobacterium sp.]